MFEHWGEFYLLVGSAAAVLIGLIFVAVTLMQDRPQSTMIAGAKFYMGPVVLQVSFVLLLSAAALMPHLSAKGLAALSGVIAVWGLYRGVESFLGIRKLSWEEGPPHWTDAWFYGVFPVLLFLILGAVAWGFWSGAEWAVGGVAIVVTGILLLSIRNEWDLVIYLAPKKDDTPRGDAEPN